MEMYSTYNFYDQLRIINSFEYAVLINLISVGKCKCASLQHSQTFCARFRLYIWNSGSEC